MVSARMGAGHDGAAAELCRRLEARGHRPLKVDFLDAAPRLGRALQRAYQAQLAAAPWSYEALYRLWFRLPWLARPTAFVLAKAFGRRLRRWVRAWQADVVVSTYPLASVALGRDRRRLGVPVATFLTDFAVHPLWVHPGVDLTLCVHPASAARAAQASGRPAVAPGPLVGDRFSARLPARDQARLELGIPPDARVALVVAGSWGVGEVEQAVADVCACGPWLPLVVCGRNPGLQRRLAARGQGVVLGWTDRMPQLMAAADVLVQNGGGLTCMEAFAAGLPVVSYRPIPGHGRQNALEMEAAGVAAYARSPEQLGPALERAATLAGRRTV
ncbi:MAG TPA: glycosyltransferase, partial [Acidimicrobiales bacterium]|nr:glycosyltransferase [Acidimicrobiales bacterium]